jgi:hypothetical protein
MTKTQLRIELAQALEALRQAIAQHQLSTRQMVRLLHSIRSISRRPPQPQRLTRTQELNKADRDYSAGIRGVALFRKHIPGLAKLSRWRRLAKQKTLMNSLHKRASRARAKEKESSMSAPTADA